MSTAPMPPHGPSLALLCLSTGSPASLCSPTSRWALRGTFRGLHQTVRLRGASDVGRVGGGLAGAGWGDSDQGPCAAVWRRRWWVAQTGGGKQRAATWWRRNSTCLPSSMAPWPATQLALGPAPFSPLPSVSLDASAAATGAPCSSSREPGSVLPQGPCATRRGLCPAAAPVPFPSGSSSPPNHACSCPRPSQRALDLRLTLICHFCSLISPTGQAGRVGRPASPGHIIGAQSRRPAEVLLESNHNASCLVSVTITQFLTHPMESPSRRPSHPPIPHASR